jgi:diguanylate cyclase (GGDEF)-like protein
VMLIPVTVLAALTGSAAVKSWSDRRHAITVEREATALAALMAARVAVMDESHSSAALVEAAAFGITPAQITSLFGVDYSKLLVQARPRVDEADALQAYPRLAADLLRVQERRSGIDSGNVPAAVVLGLFERFTDDIDAQWRQQFSQLRHDVLSAPNGTGLLSSRAAATSSAFQLLETAKDRYITCGDAVKGIGTPASVEELIQANGAFAALSAGFPGELGPKAAQAWKAWQREPAARAWEQTLAQTVTYALAGKASPITGNAIACGHAFINEPRWMKDLIGVARSSAADVADVARHEEIAATGGCQFDGAIFVLCVLLGAGASILLARAVVRPLRRLAATAHAVAEGNFTLPAVTAGGPREVAETIQAVDDMTAVLAAVERFTVTLAEDPAAPSLNVPLPGRTGRALQATLTRLREAVLGTEQERQMLQEVASHDGLTGLLNRRAAHASVELELARARREGFALLAMFIDLDGLKAINDTHGHSAGDEAIRLTAQALRDVARESDVVARIGGDEFLVVGRAPVGVGDVQALIDRLQRAVTRCGFVTRSGPVTLGCSIGSSLSEGDDDVDSLVAKADAALYRAKQRGRGRALTP